MRLSVEDNAGWGPEQSADLARIVKDKGVDVIDCSSGGMTGSPVVSAGPVGYGYQVPYAAKLRAEAGIKTMAVGLIVHADQAEAILAKGQADLIAIAREVLYNPNWPMDAAQKLGVDREFASVPSPQAYWLAKRLFDMNLADDPNNAAWRDKSEEAKKAAQDAAAAAVEATNETAN